MRKLSSLILAFFLTVASSAFSAPPPPPPPPLGPALTAIGAKFGPMFSLPNVLQINSDKPLSEDAWRELEALSPTYFASTGPFIDNAALIRLVNLPLVMLYMDGPTITDAGWAPLAEMSHLKMLTLGHNQNWKGTGAQALADHPSLVYLNIGGSTFGDAGVPPLATIKNLKNLSLGHMRVTDAGLTALANNTTIETLGLSPQGTPRMTDEMFKTIVTLKSLRELKVIETVLTYDGGLHLLQDLPKLKKVELDKVGLSDDDLAKLKAALPNVEIIFNPWTPEAIANWHEEFKRMKAQKK